ncbi:MAG: hypothetical protein Q8S13_07415 [Dehalococcoidia bacterium]|nr:hypothetical protein [Dehalococcoidia bacterium]
MSIRWSRQGRGVHFAHVATFGARRVEVSAGPSMFGKWMITEILPGQTKNVYGAPRRNAQTHAYANDLREARQKAEDVLRGKDVERGASRARFRPVRNPVRFADAFRRERVRR